MIIQGTKKEQQHGGFEMVGPARIWSRIAIGVQRDKNSPIVFRQRNKLGTSSTTPSALAAPARSRPNATAAGMVATSPVG